MEECGVSLLGLSSGNVGDSLYQPQFSDVLNCVQQCMDSGAKQVSLFSFLVIILLHEICETCFTNFKSFKTCYWHETNKLIETFNDLFHGNNI